MLSSGKTYKVKKGDLIVCIKANKVKHVEEYNAAKEKYRLVAIDKLQSQLFAATSNQKFSLHFNQIVKPISHEQDYTKVLGLLEMCIEDEMEITAQDYSQYVLDEWSWSQEFSTSNSFYGVGASNDNEE